MIELLIVVAIAAILAMIAVPSMRDMLNSTRQSSALGLIVNDLNQARGEAIKRNTHMLMCRRNLGGTNCDDSVTTPVDWHNGWVVCIEGAIPRECAVSSATDPNPMIVRPKLDASLTLSVPVAVIRFSANSSAAPATTLTLGGTWTGAASRSAAVAVTGNISKP